MRSYAEEEKIVNIYGKIQSKIFRESGQENRYEGRLYL